MKVSEQHKALILMVAHHSAKKRLVAESRNVAMRVAGQLPFGTTVLSALPVDPFRAAAKVHAYDVTIEVQGRAEPSELRDVLRGMVDSVRELVDPASSTVVAGRDFVFKAGESQPVRFQYLMRRRPDFTHEAYAKRYSEVHSDFGMRTRGVEAYVQFHIDQPASAEAARVAGLSRTEFDSVSELHMKSIATFLKAMPHNAKLGAIEDEKLFVDRANSVMFLSKVVARFP